MAQQGWYADSQNAAMQRWWDGARWTEHVRPAPARHQMAFSPGLAHAPHPASVARPDVSPPPVATFAPSTAPAVGAATGDLEAEHDELLSRVIELRETALLQEVGIYHYRHPLDHSPQYRGRLQVLSQQIDRAAKEGTAVHAAANYTLNGSLTEGRKMLGEWKKLVLRTYNTDAENILRSLKPSNLQAALRRLDQSRAIIAKLGARMELRIDDAFHGLRVQELELTADYLMKVAEEREAERERRARLKEEERVQRELQQKKALLQTERAKLENARAALEAKADAKGVERLLEKLREVDAAIADTERRAANVRAGFVYVISNLGSFGETVIKIGMTRREHWQDRVDELGDASVPFRFDVHAAIYSDDAVRLEGELHRRFADRRLNLVNLRREFFRVTPAEVCEVLMELRGELLDFVELPPAEEWWASEHQWQLAAPPPEET
ncbi:MAG: DUF4041 domain-containing protein [Polyangiaceae bacterium]|nr:DUF4041 domain-containing protein [Polyangiaceae bacterium]